MCGTCPPLLLFPATKILRSRDSIFDDVTVRNCKIGRTSQQDLQVSGLSKVCKLYELILELIVVVRLCLSHNCNVIIRLYGMLYNRRVSVKNEIQFLELAVASWLNKLKKFKTMQKCTITLLISYQQPDAGFHPLQRLTWTAQLLHIPRFTQNPWNLVFYENLKLVRDQNTGAESWSNVVHVDLG